MVVKKGYLNVHKLSGLTVNQFSKKLEELLEGKYLYRTIDGRILDFEDGSERFPSSKFSIEHGHVKHITKHINRHRKEK